jgi:ppGpp synthetase/RelA/SpoT-type nucleotidyltranferase
MTAVLTKSQVNRAGRVLRAFWRPSEELTGPTVVEEAFAVLSEWRAEHSKPLIKATNGLRSMVRSEGAEIQVSQRLKRVPTILDKLVRHPSMALASMQDIGGCRAILANVEELRRVQRRVMHRRPPVRVDDYIAYPRASGYRAIHLVVEYDARCIEIQLRTPPMHEWAVAVERLGGRLAIDLKSGYGPPEVLEWLEAVSQALAIEEAGGIVDTERMDRIRRLREHAQGFLPERGA